MRRFRPGSALIVVLGMVAFLTISAVAFAAYMRYSRVPSSYLLRASSSRWLVKAALAEALDRIENSIGNNPHPGVPAAPVGGMYWRDRVLYLAGGESSPADTVSTLTFEGLSYVPAPLVNDARYYSRRTSTATWKDFNFDSGHYAFTAIDVSDYFDVNRVLAAPDGGGRTSADDARVTLAYLFEDAAHTGWRTTPQVWDRFMDNYAAGGGATVPLVSWADLNLAIWHDKPAGVISPWCRYVSAGTDFVTGDATELLTLSNTVFVTDSLYASAKDAADVLDLSDSGKQPFVGLQYPITDKTKYRNRGVDELAQNNNDFMKKFANNLGLPELVQLCDYLDADSVPTSLAMPTAERVPMVVGVDLGNSSLKYEIVPKQRTVTKKGPNGKTSSEVSIVCYTLRLTGELRPQIVAVYPFKHGRGSDDTENFRVQVAATVTLVPKDSENELRRAGAVAPAVCPWDVKALSPKAVAYANTDCKSVIVMRSSPKPLSVKRNPKDEKDCLITCDPEFGPVNFDLVAQLPKSKYDAADDICTLRVAREFDEDGQAIGQPEVTKGFLPSNEGLNGAFAAAAKDIADTAAFEPVIQFWVRIINAAEDTVDLMPACVGDDRRPSELLRGDNVKSAFRRPLLRFYDKSGGMTLNLSSGWFEGGAAKANKEMVIYPMAYVADDPRFNHAPEDLVAVEKFSGELGDYWLANTTAKTDSNADGDIFMATSDAGYLQSKFELAHILRVTGLKGNDMWGVLDNAGYDGKERTGFGNAPSKEAQWRTYTQYRIGNRKDDIDDLKMTCGTRGTRVCPYTPDTSVMMGALANTPFDWWAASTNDQTAVKQQMLGNITKGLEYTFSDHAAEATYKVRWQDMTRLAEDLIGAFRSAQGAAGWQTAYDNLAWDGAFFDPIEQGQSKVTLDSVDRKFLHGFWRECFAAQQQLFLVFVRAEPMMIGGGGRIPPTFGGRAVVLVWRDPQPTSNGAPHRMRILSYRHLD